ncbi:MAG: hypothetical protein ACKV2T_30495 [Kofleriaceae bacterium]
MQIVADDAIYTVGPLASELIPVPPSGGTPLDPPEVEDDLTLAVFPRRSVPVGSVVHAGHLVATKRGRPTSDVDLHVTIDGASPRALRWVAPGVAEIDIEVRTWQPEVTLTVDGGGTHTSTRVPVDAGPPVDIAIDPPTVHVDEPFALVARVHTSHGIPIDRDRARVVVPGCTAANAEFRCPEGPRIATVELEIDGRWVAVDERRFEVRGAPTVPSRRSSAYGLEIGFRGGYTLHAWSAGVRVEGQRALSARGSLVASAGWRYLRDTLTRESPLSSDPMLAEHEGVVAAGIVWRPSFIAPVFVRATGGLAFVYATLGGIGVADLGLRAVAEVAAGATSHRISFALGVRQSRDLVVAGWRGDPFEAFGEVSYAFFD